MTDSRRELHVQISDLISTPDGGHGLNRERVAMGAAVVSTESDTLADQLLQVPEAWFDARKLAAALPGTNKYARTHMQGSANIANRLARVRARWIVTGEVGRAVVSHSLGDQTLIESAFPSMTLPEGLLWIEFDESAMASIMEVIGESIEARTVLPMKKGYLLEVEEGGRAFSVTTVGLTETVMHYDATTVHFDLDDPDRMDASAQQDKFGGLRVGGGVKRPGFRGMVRNFAEYTSLSIGIGSGVDQKQIGRMQNAIMHVLSMKQQGYPIDDQDMPFHGDDILFEIAKRENSLLELLALVALDHSGQIERRTVKTDLDGTGPKSLGRRYDVLREHNPETLILSLARA